MKKGFTNYRGQTKEFSEDKGILIESTENIFHYDCSTARMIGYFLIGWAKKYEPEIEAEASPLDVRSTVYNLMGDILFSLEKICNVEGLKDF